MSEINLKVLQEIYTLITTTSSDGRFRVDRGPDGTSTIYVESLSKNTSTAIGLQSSTLGSLCDHGASVASLKQCVALLAGASPESRTTLCARDGDTLVLDCKDLAEGVETVFEVPLLDEGDAQVARAPDLRAPSTHVCSTATFYKSLSRYVLSKRDPVCIEVTAGDGDSTLLSVPEPGGFGALRGKSVLAGATNTGRRRTLRISLNDNQMTILFGETRGRAASTVSITDDSLVIHSDTEKLRIRHSFAARCEV